MSALTTPRLGDPTQERVDRHARQRNLVARLVTQVCLWIGVLMSIFPFYWLITMSTNTTAEIFGFPPKLTFGTNFAENMRNLLASVDLFQALLNTILVAGALAVLVMFFDSRRRSRSRSTRSRARTCCSRC